MTVDGQEPTAAELTEAVAQKAVQGNGFKRLDGQLVWESRCLKAAHKEAASVLYPGGGLPPGAKEPVSGSRARKGLRSFVEERVEIAERYLPLGRTEPDISGEQRIKHISGAQGKLSTINAVDIVTDVTITATLLVLDDCLSPSLWCELWQYVERGGVGADRARGDGRAELVAWERLE
jgi:hypothetical protein